MAHAFGNGYVEQARRRGVREDANTSPEVTTVLDGLPFVRRVKTPMTLCMARRGLDRADEDEEHLCISSGSQRSQGPLLRALTASAFS